MAARSRSTHTASSSSYRPRRIVVDVALAVVAVLCLGMLPAHAAPQRADALLPAWVRRPCVPTAIPEPLVAGSYCRNVVVDGAVREFLLYVPAQRDAAGAPLVVMHHGSGGDGLQFWRTSGWRAVADEHGAVVAFPTGLQHFVTEDGANRWSTKWNGLDLVDDIDVARRLPGYPSDAPWPADDIAFERQLIDDVASVVPIDAQRTFVSGFSNGGSFANRVAIELPDRVAAVGASGGGAVIPATFPSNDEAPADLWLIIGSADDRFLAGSGLDELPLDPAEMATVPVLRAAMATHTLRWGLPVVPCQIDRRATSTTLVFCAAGRPEFRLSIVDDLTHVYPHGFDRRTNPSGIAAARVFWTFFASHPLGEVP